MILGACTVSTPTTPSTSQAPAAASPTSTFTIVTTPSSPELSTITGQLMLNPASPRPASQVVLALAEILEINGGTPALASFDRKTSPNTLTDSTGHFVFKDVPAQRYSLVLDRINESFLLLHPEDGGDFIFEAQPGQVLDLGQLVYSSLPGDVSSSPSPIP